MSARSIRIPRTVPARAVAKPAATRKAPLGRLGRMFPVVRQIVEATSHADRAAILLRLPDAIVLSHGDVIAAACRECGFVAGVQYLTQRSAILHATRGPDGQLPQQHRDTLELWANGMSAMARGGM